MHVHVFVYIRSSYCVLQYSPNVCVIMIKLGNCLSPVLVVVSIKMDRCHML